MNTQKKHCRLIDLPPDQEATVAKYGDLPEKEIRSLSDLGLVRGSTVRVLARTPKGPLLAAVADARMAINQEVASEIKVIFNS